MSRLVFIAHCFVYAVFIATVFLFPQKSSAATIDDLKKSIEQKNQEIQKLEDEIKKYRGELKTTQDRGKTLNGEIARLNGEIKKLTSDIALTEKQVQKKSLEIEELGIDIEDKEKSVQSLRRGLTGLIQTLFEEDKNSIFAIVVKYTLLSDFFRHIGYIDLIQDKIIDSVSTLRALQQELNSKKSASETKKEELASLNALFKSRRSAENSAKQNKNNLLIVTKSQEKGYQVLLKSQEAQKNALEAEIDEIEAKIKVIIDPSSLPSKVHGVLGSPLPEIALISCWSGGASAKNCLTQMFGYTSFAAVGNYGGNGHNGVDFRAEIGTLVLAAESGVVQGVGDTDIGCQRASYGKWILIKHSNNLSTIYAHLSAISVSPGNTITRGDHIGLSGVSGYATGPHLHFGVYATQAVSIESIRSKVCGRLMNLPISATNGYLNPLDYL